MPSFTHITGNIHRPSFLQQGLNGLEPKKRETRINFPSQRNINNLENNGHGSPVRLPRVPQVTTQQTNLSLHRPTRIRQHIRDHITSPTSPLVLKTTALTATLGYPIILDPEWTMLWKTLQVFYPDNSTFVPSIAKVIITWCEAFTSWLENDENEEPVEKLLDALKARTRLEIVIEVT